MPHHLDECLAKMAGAGISPAAIGCFRQYYLQYRSGHVRAELREDEILPPAGERLACLDELPAAAADSLAATVVIKLNGGLGTSMGLTRAKSLLEVKPGFAFLDVIARQALATGMRLLLMDSYNTRSDTLAHLAPYAGLARDGLPLDFLQHQFPRLRAAAGGPLDFGDERDWNPPGHGDLYLAIQADGLLDRLLALGCRYAFVSNADNLGASADGRIPAFMAAQGVPFVMEVCRRSPMDRKGGHLAVRRATGALCLREAAQRPQGGDRFEDIDLYGWFNTNNLWVDLQALRDVLRQHAGVMPLPLMLNPKKVDGIPVVQFETAMGAAIELFQGAKALAVPRARFVPVKKTCDLLVLRSDVYDLEPQTGRLAQAPGACLPTVDLDEAVYGKVGQLDERFPAGVPSLRACESLLVRGPVTFAAGTAFHGKVTISTETPACLPPGTYEGTVRL
jgi:UTP--glucose-1-phosphate uridylyltransferase